MKSFVALLFNFFLAVFISIPANQILGVPPAATVGILSATQFIARPSGSALAGIQVEIWVDYIIGNIFKGNEFLNHAFNADEFVLQGKVVHIPNAGVKASVQKNRASLPATIKRRKDIDVNYSLDEFTTDPILITNAEAVECSYNKMDSIMGESMESLREAVADWMIYNWMIQNGDNIIRTTGAATAAHLDSATGNRKAVKLADLRKAKVKFNSWGISKEDRFAMLDSNMLDQLTTELTTSDYKDFSRAYDPKTGVVGKLESFSIIERPTVLVADNSSTPVIKDPDYASVAASNAGALLWQKNAVERALGTVDSFEKLNDPTYYGDIYSWLLRMGGRSRRDDKKGVLQLIQAAA